MLDTSFRLKSIFVQPKRGKAAVPKLKRKLLKKQGFAPSRLVTDTLPSSKTVRWELGLVSRHEQDLRKNNRAENSHPLVRRRERKIQGFKSPGSAQRFPSIHSAAYNILIFSVISCSAGPRASSEQRRQFSGET